MKKFIGLAGFAFTLTLTIVYIKPTVYITP